MVFRVIYHPAAAGEDLPKMPADVRERIARAVETRLTTAPERYGKPLRGTLRGYWKLRVRDYRVVYKPTADEVRILAIRHRDDVYHESMSRPRIVRPTPRS